MPHFLGGGGGLYHVDMYACMVQINPGESASLSRDGAAIFCFGGMEKSQDGVERGGVHFVKKSKG